MKIWREEVKRKNLTSAATNGVEIKQLYVTCDFERSRNQQYAIYPFYFFYPFYFCEILLLFLNKLKKRERQKIFKKKKKTISRCRVSNWISQDWGLKPQPSDLSRDRPKPIMISIINLFKWYVFYVSFFGGNLSTLNDDSNFISRTW
jgi:hypothetical protein